MIEITKRDMQVFDEKAAVELTKAKTLQTLDEHGSYTVIVHRFISGSWGRRKYEEFSKSVNFDYKPDDHDTAKKLAHYEKYARKLEDTINQQSKIAEDGRYFIDENENDGSICLFYREERVG